MMDILVTIALSTIAVAVYLIARHYERKASERTYEY